MFDLIDTAITGEQFLLALHDTLIMVAVSLGFGALIGVPLGIVLVVCRPGGIVANPVVHQALNPLINVLRSLPFIILLIVILSLYPTAGGHHYRHRGGHRAADRFLSPPTLPGWWRAHCWRWMRGSSKPRMLWARPPCRRSGTLCCRSGGIADSGPYHGDHRPAWCDRHGRNGGRRRNWRPGDHLRLSAFRRLCHPHHRPGADCYCPAYSDAGDPPGSPGCVAINRSTAPGLTRLACADRGEGAGYPRNIAVVEPGHADPTAGDQIDAMLLTQNVYLIGAKAGVTEHAALGQQIGKSPAGRAACRAFTSATRMGADAGAHGLHFFLPQGIQLGDR